MGSIVDKLWPFGGKSGRPRPKPSKPEPTPVQPYASATVGINAHVLTPEMIHRIQTLGIRHVRTTVTTDRWRANDYAYRDAIREMVERCDAAGFELLVVLHNYAGGPVHAVGHDLDLLHREASTMADVIRALPTVKAWQLWNEVDVWVQAPFGAGGTAGDGALDIGRNYANWLARVLPMLREIAPGAKFVSAAPADHPSERWRGFLKGLAVMRPKVDAIGVHAYGAAPRSVPLLEDARRIVDAYGQGIPLWLTECGNDRPEHPHRLGTAVTTTVDALLSHPIVERVYPYVLWSDEAGHSLLHPETQWPTPAYDGLAKIIKGE